MSNLAIDELGSEERGLATVIDGRFMDRPPDDMVARSVQPWAGWMRVSFFVLACVGSWSVVVLAMYLLFIF